jgi:6-pyruvoyltetrahydropterin/6-carboxytetrahydropterin synthase
MAYITVIETWHMGHRLPNHAGGCRNLHGHSYIAHVTLHGAIKDTEGAEDEGMVQDFSVLKTRLRSVIAGLDHKFLLCERDTLVSTMRGLPGVVIVPFVPTAENIAQHIINQLPDVWRVKLFETPTSYAEVLR